MFEDIAPRNRKRKEYDNVRRHENGRQGEGARSYENYGLLGLDHGLSRCHLTLQRPVCILVKFGVFFIPRGLPFHICLGERLRAGVVLDRTFDEGLV